MSDDALLIEAMREVDALTPGSPPVAPPAQQSRRRLEMPGWRWDQATREYVSHKTGDRISIEAVRLGMLTGFYVSSRPSPGSGGAT